MQNVKIPLSFILEMDDVGWDDGHDLRIAGKASRSGLPRRHALEDYEQIRDLAEASGCSLAAALVLGDLDKDNVLRGEVGVTHDPFGWNRAEEIDLEKSRKYIDILESAKVDYLLHGLLHGRYAEDGKRISELEYLSTRKNAEGKTEKFLLSEEDFRHRLDLFFKIYNSWGMKKPVRGFVVPCGINGISMTDVEKMAKILYEYGIRYWADEFKPEDLGGTIKIINGVACFRWRHNDNYIPWDAYDFDPDVLLPSYIEGSPKNSCLHGSHWTNYLRFNPKKNHENIPAWLDFYKRQGEVFGSMNAKNLDEAVNQHIYYEFARLEETGDRVIVDLAGLEGNTLDVHRNEFFISFLHGTEPKSCEGGEISFYEKHEKFDIYKITHTESKVLVTF